MNNVASTNQAAENPAALKQVSDGQRNTWILTGYGIFGLCLLGLIAYTLAQYAVQ